MLICGWGSSTFMVDLIRALDGELPPGSEVTLFNLRVTDNVISKSRPIVQGTSALAAAAGT